MPPATRNRVSGGSVAGGVADGIAHPPHRMNEFSGKWFVYFGAQMANIDINDIGKALKTLVPTRAQRSWCGKSPVPHWQPGNPARDIPLP